MKKTLLALAIAGAAVSAQADTKLYGHVAFNLGVIDDNVTTTKDEAAMGRNGFSESRFGFSFSKKLDGGLTAVANQEFGLNDRGAGYTDGQNNLRIRRNSFGFAGDFGKVTLGFDNDVGDGVINADLAGTNLIDPMSSNDSATGFGVNGFDPDVGDGLRYYSPKIGGIATIGAQLQDTGGTEVALKVDVSGFRFNAFSSDTGTGTEDSGYLVGYKAPIGLSVTYVSSERKTATKTEHDGWKIGYAAGKHKVSYSNVSQKLGDEATALAYMYNMAKGVELYAVYKDLENNAGVEQKSGVVVGGRVQF
jgi:predicted porin